MKQTNAEHRIHSIWILILILPIFFVSVNIFFLMQGLYWNIFIVIKKAYIFNTIIMPIILALVGLLGVIVWRKQREDKWLFRASVLCFIWALFCITSRIYATHIEPYILNIKTIKIITPKIDRPLRILHISDIQSDFVGRYEERAFAEMRALNPDLIIHTGDLLQPLPPATTESELPKIAALFRTLHPPLGLYNVYGDVDGEIFGKSQEELGGLKTLNSEEVIIPFGNTRLRLFGLTSNESRRNPREAVDKWF